MKLTATLLGVALALVAAWINSRGRGPLPSSALPQVRFATHAITQPPHSTIRASAKERAAAKDLPASRVELIAFLSPVFRARQLAAEIDLDQRRYGEQYWQADVDGPSLRRLDEERLALRVRLAAEMNALVDELYPDGSAAPLTLAPLFDADHPAPNVRFLSAASRRQFEEALLAAWDARGALSVDAVMASANFLAGEEREAFLAWNSAPAVALRDQVAGFDADQHEFDAILHSMRTDADGAPTMDIGTLASEIGADRVAQWQRLQTAEVQTALRDLRAAGAPLTEAGWLAAARQQASLAFHRTWSDTRMSDTARAAEVAHMRRDYAEVIAAQGGASGLAADDILP